MGLHVNKDPSQKSRNSRGDTLVAEAEIHVESGSIKSLPPETLDTLKQLARMIGRQLARESRP